MYLLINTQADVPLPLNVVPIVLINMASQYAVHVFIISILMKYVTCVIIIPEISFIFLNLYLFLFINFWFFFKVY